MLDYLMYKVIRTFKKKSQNFKNKIMSIFTFLSWFIAKQMNELKVNIKCK